ncbi:hypothetical protein DUNSADRAFT_15100 [Dunaliella salina]|uniref:Uncharacterized protein n=1 Tax=Dunaliella salina TaxID=3046 RepID=A0ABQ7H213_DUNSA|nr:hypothetical protein DUNSADRAFT_15100 [Dunaliella salina]|eukprot:KAF5840900.1 hypothetical protein DUNSADRAFT_15100 [Dunaliella salina]
MANAGGEEASRQHCEAASKAACFACVCSKADRCVCMYAHVHQRSRGLTQELLLMMMWMCTAWRTGPGVVAMCVANRRACKRMNGRA